jgi:hypothetical protein
VAHIHKGTLLALNQYDAAETNDSDVGAQWESM